MRTELLEAAITMLERLSPERQDAVACRILNEVADEQVWLEQFAATSDEQWDQLAKSVRREIADGAGVPLEDFFRIVFERK